MKSKSLKSKPYYRQHKISHKGKKCIRGQAVNEYGEIKSRVNLSLTPTAISIFNDLSISLDIPRGVLLEKLIRRPDFPQLLQDSI
jgi:hypothetical protein